MIFQSFVFSTVLQQSGRNPSRKVIYKYWKGKSLSFEEFCDICAEIPKTSTDDLLKAFKRVDINGDGYISNKELRRMLTSVSLFKNLVRKWFISKSQTVYAR